MMIKTDWCDAAEDKEPQRLAPEAQREAWEQTSEGTDLTNTLDFWALGLFLNSSTNFC